MKKYKNKLIKKAIFILIIFIYVPYISAQQTNFSLGYFHDILVNKEVNKLNISINTGFKPLLKSELKKYNDFDSILYDYEGRKLFFKKYKKNLLWKKLLFEDLFYIKQKKLRISINPLMFLQYGKLNGFSSTYTINTRGIEIKGDIGDKISFYTNLRENQAFFRPYINEFVNKRQIVPGQGASKIFQETGHDFSSATAYISFTPKNWLNIQIGNDKNFIGEGYRSLFLSDNSFNYPALKLSFFYKSFKYVTMFTQFEDFERKYYNYHFKKHGAFNYLTFSYKNRFEIGIFEGIIYRTTDTAASYVNKIPADFFMPVLGIRTGINGFSAENNILAGFNTKIKITDFIQIYGQIAIDEPKNKKYAYQGGLKIFDVLHSKFRKNNLYFQIEYNKANQRTYSHPNLKFQTWSHFNQELAHPLGSDFTEFIIILNYKFKNLFANFKYSDARINNSFTFSDIYMTDNIKYLSPPQPVSIKHKTAKIGRIINMRKILQIYFGIDSRTYISHNPDITETKNFIFIGIKTELSNFYYDF